MAERLTKKDKPILKNQMEDNMSVNKNTAIKRLWQYENVMEKYGIESVEELECLIEQTPKFIVKETSEKYGQEINGVFFSNEQMLILSQYNELQEPYKKRYEQVKINRDIWKRACELACEREDDCYVYDNIHRAYEFYQQAKTDGNDES